MNKTKRVHIWVRGRVQGVGFRYFCSHKAQSLGLTGWVRNRSDGRVEAVFEGPETDVDEAIEAMRRGPSSGRVEDVKIIEEPTTGSFDSFTIEPFRLF